jgi:hypothetical protein
VALLEAGRAACGSVVASGTKTGTIGKSFPDTWRDINNPNAFRGLIAFRRGEDERANRSTAGEPGPALDT